MNYGGICLIDIFTWPVLHSYLVNFMLLSFFQFSLLHWASRFSLFMILFRLYHHPFARLCMYISIRIQTSCDCVIPTLYILFVKVTACACFVSLHLVIFFFTDALLHYLGWGIRFLATRFFFKVFRKKSNRKTFEN